MLKKGIVTLLITAFLMSCTSKEESETPLMTVIKLQSAESLKQYDIAKKYLDVNKVYGELSTEASKTPEEVWTEFIEFNYSLGQSKKFSNTFKYHEFEIIEKVNQDSSVVRFIPYNQEARIKSITYHLLRIDNLWRVIQIDYKK